jgi:hypothetical protein
MAVYRILENSFSFIFNHLEEILIPAPQIRIGCWAIVGSMIDASLCMTCSLTGRKLRPPSGYHTLGTVDADHGTCFVLRAARFVPKSYDPAAEADSFCDCFAPD